MKVKKSVKRQSPPPSDVAELIERISDVHEEDLVSILQELDLWRYARTDLHAWIPILNKFDTILAGIIKVYDLSKIQTNEFTPKTKETVLEILRVQRLLLENSTNRKLFASYDRLYDLLLTCHLDVLQAALLVLLRPAQQYASATPLEGFGAKLSARLLHLAKGWERLHQGGWNLVKYASAQSLTPSPELSQMLIEFYPTTQSQTEDAPNPPISTPSRQRASSSKQAYGSTILDLGNVMEEYSIEGLYDAVTALGETHKIPQEELHGILNRIRLVVFSADVQKRRQLLSIRLLALATIVYLSSDDAAHSTVFLYEPDLVYQIGTLIRHFNDTDDIVTSFAIYALDACAHHHDKTHEVLSSLSINVNHGSFLSLFRSVISRLEVGENVYHELVDSCFGILALVASITSPSSNTLGAGVLTSLLELLSIRSDRRDSYIPRACGLIDSILFPAPSQTLPIFGNVNGLDILISRVKAEIETVPLQENLKPTEWLSNDTIIAYHTGPLKAILRTLHRIMSAAGVTEGFRNVSDTDLPRSVKRILQEPEQFGAKVYAIAINMLAGFIHNEPTSLSLLQEQELPQTFVAQLEKDMPTALDVLITITTSIGAICLNESGLKYATSRPLLIKSLIKAMSETTEGHGERENIQHLSSHLDELVRHHPTMRPLVMDGLLSLLKETVAEGEAFVPAEAEKHLYGVVAAASTEEGKELKRPTSNPPLNKLVKVFKVLEGVLRNSTICKEFIQEGGLDILCNVGDLPCIPNRVLGTDMASGLAQVFRMVGEHDHIQLVERLVKSTSDVMAKCETLWKSTEAKTHWKAVEDGRASGEIQAAACKLQGLATRISFLGAALIGLAFSQSHPKIAASLIRALGVSSGSSFVSDLGRLHRVAFQQHVRMKPVTRPVSTTDAPTSAVIGTDEAPATPVNVDVGQKEDTGIKIYATRLHGVLTKFFKSAIRLLYVKRTPDANHQTEAKKLSGAISDIIIEHLRGPSERDTGASTESVSVGLATMLLFDDRAHEGHLQTYLFLSFYRKGGMTAMTTAISRILNSMDLFGPSPIPKDKGKEKEVERDADSAAKIQATAGTRVALYVLNALASPRALIENAQTHALHQRSDIKPPLKPVELFIRIRLEILPVIYRIWSAPWLTACPPAIIKTATQAFLTIMQANREEPIDTAVEFFPTEPTLDIGRAPAARPPAIADPARVDQLMDMGFARTSAELALVRARNNVGAAADIILTMPHLFAELPTEPDQTVALVVENVPGVESTGEAEETAPPTGAGEGASDDSTGGAQGSGQAEDEAGEAEEMDIDETPAASAREDLNSLRDGYRDAMTGRALQLVDESEDLVFDLIPAFPKQAEGFSLLLERTREISEDYVASNEKVVSARLRLSAIFLHTNGDLDITSTMYATVDELFTNLPASSTPRPIWLPSLLLFLESLGMMCLKVNEAKLGDDGVPIMQPVPDTVRVIVTTLLDTCVEMIADHEASRDEIMAGFRFIVVATRIGCHVEDKATAILSSFRQKPSKLVGCQPYLAMIIRHMFEDSDVLRQIMQKEIRQWFTPARNKVTDINHFVSQLRQAVSRDPAIFVQAVAEECALVDPTPPHSVYHIRAKSEVKDLVSSEQCPTNVVSGLLAELGQALQTSLQRVIDESTEEPADLTQAHSYAGLLLSTLTETVGSYITVKKGFIQAVRQINILGTAKSRTGLHGVVSDLVCCVRLDQDLTTGDNASKRTLSHRFAISSWTSCMLVALCADDASSEASEDVTVIRRTVLDVIGKNLKELGSAEPAQRYGRLWALSELVNRLLNKKSTVNSKVSDESNVQIAKLMLERSFVSHLTHAVGDLDLKFPGVRIVLTSVLRTLEQLTRISIKWSKTEKKSETGGRLLPPDPSPVHSEDESDVDMEDDIGAPDLYRNSALGMLGGEMRNEGEDDDSDDEDDDEDDMIETYGDDPMDEMDDEADDTDPSTEHDDDIDEMDHDWTDEDEEDEDSHEEGSLGAGPQVLLGAPNLGADEAGEWDYGGEIIETGQTSGDEEEEGEDIDDDGDDDGDDDDDEGMYDMGMMEGEAGEDEGEGEGEGEDLMEEPDYNHFDYDDAIQAAGTEGFDLVGHWGWDEPAAGRPSGPSQRPTSRLLEDPMSELFGERRPAPSSGPAEHPLITDPSSPPRASRRGLSQGLFGNLNELIASLEGVGGGQAMRLLEGMIAQTSRGEPVRINLSADESGVVGISIGGRAFNLPSSSRRATPAASDPTSEYVPKPTLHRWQEELALRSGSPTQMTSRVVTHIINRLMPIAKQKEEEEGKRRAEEERQAESEARKAGEETMNAATATPLPESAAQTRAPTPVPGGSPRRDSVPVLVPAPIPSDDVEMAPASGAVAADPSNATLSTNGQNLMGDLLSVVMAVDTDILLEQVGPSQNTGAPIDIATEAPPTGDQGPQAEPTDGGSLARTMVTVRGREVDITDSGIDVEFLQALPEDMQADVVEQHMREQDRARRPRNPTAPEASSNISPEFLDALPSDIRAEVILQEATENARRNVPTADTGAADVAGQRGDRAGEPGENAEAPPGGLLAGLDQDLRDVMLMGAGGGLLGMPGNGGGGILGRGARITPARGTSKMSDVPKPPREAVQLLDRPGVAAVVRLLFFPETFKKDHLFRILANLCANSATRSDLLNLLLSVIQDGSGDLSSVDKSFQQMSLRPPTTSVTPKPSAKTKAADTSVTPAPPSAFADLQSGNIPTFIAQRCFEALSFIVTANSQAVNYFLTEHEQTVGLKKPVSKKGKSKEKVMAQTKYPIVILLGLLDRTALLTSPGMMESLTALLATVTKPLSSLPSVDKPEDDPKAIDSKTSATTRVDGAASIETTDASNGLPATSSKDVESSTAAQSKTDIAKAPVIPASILKLVVNCLTLGDCSSRNFTQTLVVMRHLSNIRDGKTTILQEIQSRSGMLGQSIQVELDELKTWLDRNTTDIEPEAFGKFSPASSNQAQLLRLLKTIEYLQLEKVDSEPPVGGLSSLEQEVRKCFDDLSFDPMWTKVGECLHMIKARGDKDQTAQVLLPLVEALMVVSKYRQVQGREDRSPSAGSMSPKSPLSAAEIVDGDLFVSFTTTHRQVLNAIVRTNPALLSGSFSLLIRNSKILEFDNKRNWFFQKLKRKRDQHVPVGHLHLNVRRQYVFEDSFSALRHRRGEEVKYGKLNVKFYHEDGIDAGGVTREWFTVLAQQIFDPNFALFEPCAADQQTYQPNKASAVNGEHLAYFKFVGRIIGKAVYDGRLLDAYFNRAFYKQILGRRVDMRDLESIDPEYHKSLQWMLDNDITGIIDQEFTIEDDQFGEKTIVELKEGGAAIPVTEENKAEYVRLVVTYRLDNSIKTQIKAFLEGFYDIIPRQLVQIFEPDQLELLISGISTVDVDELKNSSQMSGYKASDPEVAWFWRALRSFSQEERSRFLMFLTSSSRVPLGGFTQLVGASGIQPFQIQKLYAREGSLPQASTCFNLLLLPNYASYEQLREKLLFAMTETSGFGKA